MTAPAARRSSTRLLADDVGRILERSRALVADNASLRTRLMEAREAALRARVGHAAWFVAGLAVGHWAFGG